MTAMGEVDNAEVSYKRQKMQSQQISTMFTVQGMRKFVCDRLTEAAQEILGAFEKRAQEYELELARQRRLLESVYSPANPFLSDDTSQPIKEEQNDVTVTEIHGPASSSSPQDVQGESQSLNPKEAQTGPRKEQGPSTSQQATEVPSHYRESSTQNTTTGNKHDTSSKPVHKKCSHGYRVPKGYSSKQVNASKNDNMPVSSTNTPTTVEIIEIEDNSLSSSDIEIIRGHNETTQSVDMKISDATCDKAPVDENNPTPVMRNSSNEEKSSLPQPPSPALNQDGDIFNMEYGAIVDSIQNESSDIASFSSLDFSLDCSDPPDYEENMTLPDDRNHINVTIFENATSFYKDAEKLLEGQDGKSTFESTCQMKGPSSVVTESSNVDTCNNLTFTDLDNVEKIWHATTGQAFNKDATHNTASTSFTESFMRQIPKDTPFNVTGDTQPMFTQNYEMNIGSSRTNQDSAPAYSYEWKRPTQTKAANQDAEKNPFQCDICGKISSNFKNYKSHVKSHTTEKRFKCETCGKMFRESWDLNKHQKIHTGEKPFKCTDCEKAFNRRFNLDLHKRVHTGEKPYTCGSCEKAFTSRVNLRKHERTHTGEKPYTCVHCQKEFADSSSFRNHQRVHTGEKPYKCCFCKKKFATRTTLKRHIRVHTGEKPYKCGVCEKSFANNTDMKVHTRIHTGERPYKCESCEQEFSSWTNYKRHTNIHKPKVTEQILQ